MVFTTEGFLEVAIESYIYIPVVEEIRGSTSPQTKLHDFVNPPPHLSKYPSPKDDPCPPY